MRRNFGGGILALALVHVRFPDVITKFDDASSSLLQIMFAASFIPTDQHGQEDPHQEA
jgi:hypothetical protein